MQQWGDAQVTLGLIQGAVALGCLVGPLAMNAVVATRPLPLAWGVAASFGFVLLGFLLMLAARGIALLLLATFVREMGAWWGWLFSASHVGGTMHRARPMPRQLSMHQHYRGFISCEFLGGVGAGGVASRPARQGAPTFAVPGPTQ